jgi:hypothetical protein
MLHVRICAGGAGPTSVPTATKPARSTNQHQASTKKTLNFPHFVLVRGSFLRPLPMPHFPDVCQTACPRAWCAASGNAANELPTALGDCMIDTCRSRGNNVERRMKRYSRGRAL